MNDLERMTLRTIERTMRGNARPEQQEVRNAARVRAENARRHAERHAAVLASLGASQW